MRIEGRHNDDKTEIEIIVKLESEGEFEAFTHFFQEMIQNMTNAADAILIDPINEKIYTGDNVTEEMVVDAMKDYAIQKATEINLESIPGMRINFI
jgi:hypothetical protein